jgi:two-component system chemotaxis response regulator CheY
MPFSDFPPVLLVDDVPMILEVVQTILGRLGFQQIDTAEDGSTALTCLGRRQYGLVISDWNMTPMTGYELLKRVRSDRAMREVPFIMMTTQANADYFSAARKAGVNACLTKPFTPATLRETIVSVCSPLRARVE